MEISDQRNDRKTDWRFNRRSLSKSELADYNTEGYIVLDELLTERGLQEMVEQCMASWRAEKGEFDPEGTWLKNSLLGNIHQRAPIVRDY